MGSTHSAVRALHQKAEAEETLREDRANLQRAEEERQHLTSFLGTKEQTSMDKPIDSKVLEYLGRYNVDRQYLDNMARGWKRLGSDVSATEESYVRGLLDSANNYLAQAQAAAESGDFARASELKAQAQKEISGETVLTSSLAQADEIMANAEREAQAFESQALEAENQAAQAESQGFKSEAKKLRATAKQLRGQASTLRKKTKSQVDKLKEAAKNKQSRTVGLSDAFNLVSDASKSAKVRASSTEGLLVGRQLRMAQGLQDPNSEEFQSMRSRLLDPALAVYDDNMRLARESIERSRSEAEKAVDYSRAEGESALSAEQRAIKAQFRSRAASGAGRNLRGEIAQDSLLAETVAGQRAKLYNITGAQKAEIASQSELQKADLYQNIANTKLSLIRTTNAVLEDIRLNYAADAIQLARDWVNGTAGVRDTFQLAMNSSAVNIANMAERWANVYTQEFMQKNAEKQASKDRTVGLLTGLATAVAGAFGGPLAAGVTKVTGDAYRSITGSQSGTGN